MNDNEEIRAEFITYIKENGVKIKFIAEKVEIPFSTLSKWKNRDFDFRIDKLIKIKKYLNQNSKQD